MVATAGLAGPTSSHIDSVRSLANNAVGANLLGYVPERNDTAPSVPGSETDPALMPGFAHEFSGIALEHPELTPLYGVGISALCLEETYEPHEVCDLNGPLVSAISAELLDYSIWALRVNTLESICFNQDTGKVDAVCFRNRIQQYINAIHDGNPTIRIVIHLTLKPRYLQPDSVERFMDYLHAVDGLVESAYAGIGQPSSWQPTPDPRLEPETIAAMEEVLTLTGAGTPPTPTPSSTPTLAPTEVGQPDYENVPYGEGERNVFDLYIPEGDGPFPVVAWFHGGGGTSGDKGMIKDQALLFNANGIAVAAANYTYVTTEPLPFQVMEAKAMIRYLRYYADDYRLDADRIGIAGGSAGAIIASTVSTSNGVAGLEGTVGNLEGLVSSDVQAAMILAGVYNWQKHYANKWTYCLTQNTDVPECYTDNEKYHFFACYLNDADCRDRLILSSAITYVTAGDPNSFYLVGERDETPRAVPDHDEMVAELQKVGVDATLWVETNDACDTHGNMWPCVADLVVAWAVEHL